MKESHVNAALNNNVAKKIHSGKIFRGKGDFSLKKGVPKSQFIYLPKTWEDDLKAKLKAIPPNFKYDIDYFKYLGQLPYFLMARKKMEKNYKRGFIPVNKEILQGRVHEYRKYLDYLCEHDLMEENQHCKVGRKSMSIRYPAKYVRQSVRAARITKYTLIKSLIPSAKKECTAACDNQIIESNVPNYDYLTNWFNPNLTIDTKQAHEILKQMELEEVALMKQQGESPQKDDFNHARFKFNARCVIVDKINRQDYATIRTDKKAGRFHSPLTVLKKELRKTLRYGNQKLVSIDIVNSQPFFLIGLLDPTVFRNNSLDSKIFRYNPELASDITSLPKVWNSNLSLLEFHQLESLEERKDYSSSLSFGSSTESSTLVSNPVHFLPVCTTIPYLYDYDDSNLIHYSGDITSIGTTMLVNFISQLSGNEDVRKYTSWATQGVFYEEFGKELESRGLIPDDGRNRRDVAKQCTFVALFEKANAIHYRDEIKAFRAVFPTVYEIIQVVKYGKVTKYSHPYAALSLTMQAFEAKLILYHCCGTIATERPEIPIFTIHDSITTSIGNEKYVQEVMERTFREIVGYVPQFKQDYWV